MKAYQRSLIGYVAFFLIGQCMVAAPVSALPKSDGLALTPPMGWSSWNHFGCYKGTRPHLYPGLGIDEPKTIAIADAMLKKFNGVSMKDAGYQYVNLDDCFLERSRDVRGGLVAKQATFPKGMRAIGDSIRARGLKFGIYSCIFENTCATKYDGQLNGQPGMWKREQQDADTFVAWGIDYLKVDYCGYESHVAGKTPAQLQQFAADNYSRVSRALKEAVKKARADGKPAKDIVFSVCEWGKFSPWLWADSVGHLWRTAQDITKDYGSMMSQINAVVSIADTSAPGGWNDPDMMQVGNFGSDPEVKTHYCAWSILAAPMIAGNDLRTMSDFVKSLYTNAEINSVNQDSLGKAGKLVQGKTNAMFVLSKRLQDTINNEHAVLVVNGGNSAGNLFVRWDSVTKFTRVKFTSTDKLGVRDLVTKTDKGEATGGYTVVLNAHDCFFFKVKIAGTATRFAIEKRLAQQKANQFDFSISLGAADINVRSSFKNRASFTVCDLKGAVLQKAYGQGAVDWSIPLQKIGRGIYFVTMQSADRAITKQLILQ